MVGGYRPLGLELFLRAVISNIFCVSIGIHESLKSPAYRLNNKNVLRMKNTVKQRIGFPKAHFCFSDPTLNIKFWAIHLFDFKPFQTQYSGFHLIAILMIAIHCLIVTDFYAQTLNL